ncbi:MAG TPA: hypothetical protein VLI72_00205 [Methylibium sp.]|nr:hypothetical protein [Methylibium sp.]
MLKLVIVAGALLLAGQVHAQAKKDLVQKVLQAQQGAIEATGQQLAEQPANAMLQRAAMAVQGGLPPEQREAVVKDLQAAAKKYADEAVPLLRKRAVELAPTTIGPVLEEKFSEDELKQLATLLNSPLFKRYQQLGGDMQKALATKLVAETRPTIEPKIRALEQQMAQRLQAAQKAASAPAAGSAPPAPAAPAASKK